MSNCGCGGTTPPVTIFAGMSRAQLLAALTRLQQVYLNLMAGGQGESFSYTQGDGTKSVTYTRANMAALSATIEELQQLLGMTCRARRPIRFFVR